MKVSPFWKNSTKHEDTEQRATNLADLLTDTVLMSDRSPGHGARQTHVHVQVPATDLSKLCPYLILSSHACQMGLLLPDT